MIVALVVAVGAYVGKKVGDVTGTMRAGVGNMVGLVWKVGRMV
jgi:hypothetical protein